MGFIKSHPVISGVLAVDLIVITLGVVVMSLNLAKNAAIEILVAPRDAEVIIDGTSYENGTYNLNPGKHLVTVKKDGFETKTAEVELISGQTARFSAYLADADGNYDYYATNDSDRALLAELGADDKEVQDFLKKYNKITSVKAILPYNYDAYSNNYTEYTNFSIVENNNQECAKIVCLKIIDRTGNSRQLAMNVLKNYDVNNYEITYEYQPYGTKAVAK